jgi:hypothetical protein
VEFFALCADNIYERFFIVSGSTPVEQTNPAMVWRQPSSLDHGDAVFSKPVVLGLSVCPCFGRFALAQNAGAYPCGLVGAGGLVGV